MTDGPSRLSGPTDDQLGLGTGQRTTGIPADLARFYTRTNTGTSTSPAVTAPPPAAEPPPLFTLTSDQPQAAPPPQEPPPPDSFFARVKKHPRPWITFVLVSAVSVFISLKFSKKPVTEDPGVKAYNQKALKRFMAERGRARDPLGLQIKFDKQVLSALTIRNNREGTFKPQVEKALELIWTADREVFNALKRHVYVIRMGDVTDFRIENGVPTIILTGRTALRSPTWCAGAIAHQLFVARNYFALERDRKRRALPPELAKPKPQGEVNAIDVDYSDMDSIEDFEKQADNFQFLLMQAIGAPSNELNAIRTRKPYDYSFTHDGIYQPGLIGK